MPREARIDVPDHWYHVIARGQRRSDLFFDAHDRKRYLRTLGGILGRNYADLVAYCLMTNHVHLLIYRRVRSLGTIFRQAHMRYAHYFNDRHRKVGYVFQGRFKSFLVLSEKYLSALIRYIHFNPVAAKLVSDPSSYRWSSDKFYRGGKPEDGVRLIRAPGFEGRGGVGAYRDLMGDEGEIGLPIFDQFIGEEGEEKTLDRRKVGRERWGRSDRRGFVPFQERVWQLMKETKVSLEELRSRSRLRSYSRLRREMMSRLYVEGYLPSEIAECFKRTPAAVIHAHARQK